MNPGETTILEIGVSYLDELCPSLGPEVKMPLIHAMSSYLSHQATYSQIQGTFLAMIGRTEPIDRLREIVEMPDDPPLIVNENNGDSDDGEDFNANNPRRKTRSWTPQEDTRLLAGIYRYGIDNWTTISVFIGNGRTRAQCCQRWTRGLNPRISKNLWSYEEDLRLVQLVNTYGDKSWTKIASMMGNRSDVQCRYHYHQVMRDMPPLFKKSLNLLVAENGTHQISPEFEQIRSAIEAQLPNRYSLPQFSNPGVNLMQAEQICTPPENSIIDVSGVASPGTNQIQPNNLSSSNLTQMRPALSQPSFAEPINTPHVGQSLDASDGQSTPHLLAQLSDTAISPLSGQFIGQFQLPPANLCSSFSNSSFGTSFSINSNQSDFASSIDQKQGQIKGNNLDRKVKFPPPTEFETSFAGAAQIDSFLKDFM
ncbi:Myb-like DNA-binding domain containing protein [Tritrichomonas foetus]|uniref:Myb-like DNA-binding domain containing protein n=1 Tax=Tritrichomonas foetus TaxID=1144522 RepID=A0A1J4K0K7_9EUKA|nr:Myb-like DNA-binding domain containing protein [Tritrichomonas foetus]|eukprot:OHT04969.1 Myb-like DNA-binding domain containing protein [Tritrichomonas foetus]